MGKLALFFLMIISGLSIVSAIDNIVLVQMDDAQAGWDEAEANATVTYFNDNGTYLNAEVIPVNLANTTSFRDNVKNWSLMPYVQLCMGQYDHDTTQSTLTYAQTVSDLNAGNTEFNTIGVTVPTCFIPAFDYGDNDTFDALNDTNYTVEIDYSVAPSVRNGTEERPLTVHNGTELTDNVVNGLLVADAVLKTNVDNQIASKGYASLAIHMQDFEGPNYVKINAVISNLSWLKGQGYTFMTAQQYYNYLNGGVTVDNAGLNESSILVGQLVRLNASINSLTYIIDTVLATFMFPNTTEVNVTMFNANATSTLDSGDREAGVVSVQGTGSAGGVTCVNETEGFESAPFPFGNWSTGGNANWFNQSLGTTVYSGMYAIEGGNVADSQITWVRVNQNFCTTMPGGVQFWWKVDSESTFDFLCFCGERLGCTCHGEEADTSETRISGNVNWTSVSNNTGYSGNTTIEWTYRKDSATSTAPDIGYLDAVTFYNIQQTGEAVDGVDTNSDFTTYADVDNGVVDSISIVNVSVTIDSYNNSASVLAGNLNPDVGLEIYNGSDWLTINNYSVTGAGSYSLTTTDATIISAWLTTTNRDVRLRGVGLDYNTTGYVDEVNYSQVLIVIDGLNNTDEYYYDWTDTSTSGAYNVTHIIANDSNGGYNDTAFDWLGWEVNATNNPPNFEPISDFNTTENFGTLPINLQANITDEDADALLTYNWTVNNTNVLTLDIVNTTGIATFTSQTNASGSVLVIISVVDTGGLSNSTQFTITVNDVTPPYIDFVDPTIANNLITPNTSVEINVSVEEDAINSFTWNWNETNYSFYDDDLILMYNFENKSELGEGSFTVVDMSRYGNNASFTSNGTEPKGWVSTGKYDGGWLFDGDGDYLQAGSTIYMYTNEAKTFSIWFKGTNLTSSSAILYHEGGCRGYNVWLLSSGQIQGRLTTTDPNSSCVSTTSYQVNSSNDSYGDSNWHQAVLVLNRIDNVLSFYVDGVWQGNSTIDAVNNSAGGNFRIAAQWDGTANFNGTIDDVKAYNRSLNPEEVKQLYYSNLYRHSSSQWVFYTSQPGLSLGNYTYFGAVQDRAGNENVTAVRLVEVGNNPPTVDSVEFESSKNPTENGNSSISFNFTVIDLDVPTTLTETLTINFSSGESRINTTCDSSTAGSVTTYTCWLDLDYYLPSGTWTINASACDSSMCVENITETFTYGSLTATSVSPGSVGFPESFPGQQMRAANSINMTNTGNINSSSIDVRGVNLLGEDSTIFYGVDNFTIKVSDDCGGDTLSNDTYVPVTNALLPAGFNSQEELFFCITQTPMLISQNYNTTAGDSWVVRIN